MAKINFPHIFRIISRKDFLFPFFAIGILIVFSLFLFQINNLEALKLSNLSNKPADLPPVLGKSDNLQVALEIVKTLEVVNKQPDYAAAWFKLGLLYEQIDQRELATNSFNEANKLGIGF